MAEDATNAALNVDRGFPIANEPSPDGRRALRVLAGNAAAPANWKGFLVAFPSDTQEIYSFYADFACTKFLSSVTLNYTDSTKNFLAGGGVVP
jgi:hypothetical protein